MGFAGLLAGILLGFAAFAEEPPEKDPYVLILGTAQDGGLPQIGCDRVCCERVRNRPDQRRLVTSVLVCDPSDGKRWLFDCTPDLREQVDRSRRHPPTRQPEGPRPRLFEGIFLTHAHVGHYTGLMFLGPECYGAREVPVWGSKRMIDFLAGNGPWDLLVDRQHIVLRSLEPDRPLLLNDRLTVMALEVPHRDEYTDTLAFVIRGPSTSLLYLPDIDKWDRWERRIETLLDSVDVALLDGCFYAEGEIPGRSMAEIPHPFITESLARFRDLPAATRGKILFTHLNHTNPACDPESAEAQQVRRAGFAVAREGQVIRL